MTTYPKKKSCEEETKILNLKSNRCIKVNGSSFKKFLKLQVENNEQYFHEDDLAKHGYTVKTANIPKKVENKISNYIANKLKQKAMLAIQKNKSGYYVNKEHKAYCKGEHVRLTEPVINKTIQYRFTYTKTPVYGHFKKSMFEDVLEPDNFKVHMDDLIYNGIPILTNNHNRKLNVNIEEEESNIIDIEWFNQLDMYISKLKCNELFALYGYTYRGDEMVNNFLRGTFDLDKLRNGFVYDRQKYLTKLYLPIFFESLGFMKDHKNSIQDYLTNKTTQVVNSFNADKHLLNEDFETSDKKEAIYDFVVNHISYLNDKALTYIMIRYSRTLQKVIDNAPPLKKKMIVYRGVADDFYFQNKMDDVMFKNKGFVSTSIHIGTALSFTKDKCCLKKITLLPGTKTVWLGGVTRLSGEDEFLLGFNTTYLIRSHMINMRPLIKHESACLKNTNELLYSEIVAV
jgi:hypothetical protein